jgi:AcrR family transcriptional regulator
MAAPGEPQGGRGEEKRGIVMGAQLERVVAGSGEEDSAKRRQIIEGARQVFLAQGFDAASMGEIARVAGVSKGTLYVYFKDKEELFDAIIGMECRAHAESIFSFDPGDHDVAAVLVRLGVAYVKFLCRPGGAAPLRAVTAIADRMPEMGRRFYETGPARGIALLAAYLEAQVAAGVLKVEDCEVAAAQFMDACQSTLFKPLLFNFGTAPSSERIEHVVKIAVRTFMAAYGHQVSGDQASV